MPDLANLAIIGAITAALLALTIWKKSRDWLPLILLPIIWYVPRQTAPGGLLSHYLFLRWLTSYLLPLLLLSQLAGQYFNREKIRLPGLLVLPLLLFTLIAAVAGLVNHNSWLTIVAGLLLYLRYPLFFIFLLNLRLPARLPDLFLKVFFALVILQIPECLYRFFFQGIYWDHLSWSLGPWGTADLGIYLVYAAAYITAWLLTGKKAGWLALLLPAFFLLALLGEIKAFVMAAPLTILAVMIALPRSSYRKKWPAVLAFFLFIVASSGTTLAFWPRLYPKVPNDVLIGAGRTIWLFQHPALIKARTITPSARRPRSLSRLNALAVVLRQSRSNAVHLWLGYGPASRLKAGGLIQDESAKLPTRPVQENQLSALLMSFGLLGFLSYFWLLGGLGWLIWQIRSATVRSDRSSDWWPAALFGLWTFYSVLGPFYELVWRFDASSFIFYSCLAFACLRYLPDLKTAGWTNESPADQ